MDTHVTEVLYPFQNVTIGKGIVSKDASFGPGQLASNSICCTQSILVCIFTRTQVETHLVAPHQHSQHDAPIAIKL